MTLRKYLSFAILFLIALSCSDDGLVGESIKPDQDQLSVNKIDNVLLEYASYHPDSLQTDGQSQMLLGAYWHEKFGTASADIALQFRFDSILIDKEKIDANQVIVDSVFVVLIFRDYYGDSLAVNQVNVYELKETVDNYTDYYSNEDPTKYYDEQDLLGSAFFTAKEPNVPDSVSSLSDYFYRVKVPLKNELAEKFLDNYDNIAAGTDLVDRIEIFQNYLKGLYVKPVLGNRTILSIPTELASTTEDGVSVVDFTNLQFYYHYKDDEGFEEDTTRIQYFLFNGECGRFNRLSHDFQGTVFENADEVKGDNLYVRGMGGVNVRLTLPDLSQHPDMAALPGDDSARIAINSATLTLTINEDEIDVLTFYPPQKLVIRIDQDTVQGRIVDDNADFDDGYLGGTITSDGSYYYEFNITEQVQYWFNNPEEQKDLIIQPAQNIMQPAFTILNGTDAAENPLKLEIVFSRY